MQPYIVIHFALYKEAESIIKSINAKLINRLKGIQLFNNESTYIIISGTGYINTANAITWLHCTYPHIINKALCINIGLAASESLNLYSWNYAGCIIDYATDKKFYTDIFTNEIPQCLFSVNKPADHNLTQLHPNAMFDMEGFSFVKTCQIFQPNHHIHIYKFISDKGDLFLDPDSMFKHYSENVIDNLNNLTHQIKYYLKKYLKEDSDNKLDDFLLKTENQFSLTFYQKNQLKNAVKYFLCFNTMNELEQIVLNKKFKHKRDKNYYFNNLINQLYAF